MNITAFLMGICPPQRLEWLDSNISYLDGQNFPFKHRILAIDEFHGNTFPSHLKERYERSGWQVIVDSHHSRAKTMSNVLEKIDTPYIFYNEDDVLSTLPNINDIEQVFNTQIGSRECGMVSMTLGGTEFEAKDNYIGDLEYINDKTILVNDKYRIFERSEATANSYFFEFPGLFIKTSLFKKCHEDAFSFKNSQIEQALTLAYFKNKFHKTYYKASVCKPNALEILKVRPQNVNSECRLLENLDSNQGGNSCGGNLFY